MSSDMTPEQYRDAWYETKLSKYNQLLQSDSFEFTKAKIFLDDESNWDAVGREEVYISIISTTLECTTRIAVIEYLFKQHRKSRHFRKVLVEWTGKPGNPIMTWILTLNKSSLESADKEMRDVIECLFNIILSPPDTPGNQASGSTEWTPEWLAVNAMINNRMVKVEGNAFCLPIFWAMERKYLPLTATVLVQYGADIGQEKMTQTASTNNTNASGEKQSPRARDYLFIPTLKSGLVDQAIYVGLLHACWDSDVRNHGEQGTGQIWTQSLKSVWKGCRKVTSTANKNIHHWEYHDLEQRRWISFVSFKIRWANLFVYGKTRGYPIPDLAPTLPKEEMAQMMRNTFRMQAGVVGQGPLPPRPPPASSHPQRSRPPNQQSSQGDSDHHGSDKQKGKGHLKK